MIFAKLLIVLIVIFFVSKIIDYLRESKKKYTSTSGNYVLLDAIDAFLWSGQAIFFFVVLWSFPVDQGDLANDLAGSIITTMTISIPFGVIWSSVFWIVSKSNIRSEGQNS